MLTFNAEIKNDNYVFIFFWTHHFGQNTRATSFYRNTILKILPTTSNQWSNDQPNSKVPQILHIFSFSLKFFKIFSFFHKFFKIFSFFLKFFKIFSFFLNLSVISFNIKLAVFQRIILIMTRVELKIISNRRQYNISFSW